MATISSKRTLTQGDDYSFAVWRTEGDALVKRRIDNKKNCIFVFVTAPLGHEYIPGDTMPAEWPTVAANKRARTVEGMKANFKRAGPVLRPAPR